MIIEKLEVGPFSTNCYIVGAEAGGEGMIIDPGDKAGRILKRAEEHKLDIKLIVLTHGHIDHTGALKKVKEKTGVDVAVHADDAESLGKQPLGVLLGLFYPTPLPPDRLLQDGDSIDVGGLHFKVLHTPGHSPGGICLVGEGVAFSGDTLFEGSIGRTDLPGGDYDKLMGSIQTKLMMLPDDTIVYPGHGGQTTIGAERRGNPYLQD